MDAKYIYRVYRTIEFVSELMDGHRYDYNCAMAMMQVVDPIPAAEQNAIVDFMNDYMERLTPAYQEGYDRFAEVVAAIMAEKNKPQQAT